jgi:quinolinate synthase
MIRYVNESPAKEFIVATETGILHRMQKDHPEKLFIPASPQAICSYMKMNTLEKVVKSLETLQPEVKVPEDLAKKAWLPIKRMMEIV